MLTILKAFTWNPQWASQTTPFFTQGGYVLGVATTPDGRSYAGGIGLRQSDGQGGVVNIQDASAGFVTGKTIHVDEHVIVFVPYDGKVYVGTDGGLFRFSPKPNAPGVDAWESLNSSSLRNLLSESVAFSPAAPLVVLAGHQDNGIANNADSVWNWSGGNEGEKMYFDPNDRQGKTVYAWDASLQAFLKSTDGGKSFFGLTHPGAANFEMSFHPVEKDRFMVNSQTGNNEFTVMETTDGWTDVTKLRNLNPPIAGLGAPTAIAYAGDRRYVAAAGRLFQGRDAGQGQVVWNNMPLFQGPMIVSVVADPSNTNTIYVATRAGVFSKADQTDAVPWTVGSGGNLADLTGVGPSRLPFPINKLTVIGNRGRRAAALYVSTTGGVFKGKTNAGGTTWVRLGVGLPDVLVSDLDVNGDTHYVYVSLFGRGLWYLADYSR